MTYINKAIVHWSDVSRYNLYYTSRYLLYTIYYCASLSMLEMTVGSMDANTLLNLNTDDRQYHGQCIPPRCALRRSQWVG